MKGIRKVCVVITARPSYSRIKTLLYAIKRHEKLKLQLVVAASALLKRYGSVVNYIKEDCFEITAKVYNILEGESLTSSAKTTGIGIIELSTVFDNIRPDIVVTVADRFETMATAVAASYMNIPLAHIQGGEVTGNIDEKVRHAITKLSDYHFTSTEDAKQRVIKLGEDPSFVFNTGCPSVDIARKVKKNPKLDFDPYKKYGGVGSYPDISKGYLVVMQHPVTTEYEDSKNQIIETLMAIKDLKIPVLWFWPNVDAGSDGTSSGIRTFREKYNTNHIHFFRNMEGEDFLKILLNSKGLIGNSSVGIRECSYLAIPVINIGSRQNKRQRGHNVFNVGYSRVEILNIINLILNLTKPKASNIYGNGNAGQLIADILSELPLIYHKTISY